MIDRIVGFAYGVVLALLMGGGLSLITTGIDAGLPWGIIYFIAGFSLGIIGFYYFLRVLKKAIELYRGGK